MLSTRDISLITVTFNSEQIVKKFLLQTELNILDDKNIIIVDNNSNDKTLKTIKNTGKKCLIISNKKNFGYGKAVNIGMTKVKTKFCLIVNPDLLFEKNFFKKLLNGVKKNPEFGLIAPRLSSVFPKNKISKQDISTKFISGACFLIDVSILKNIVFDENIFLFYEDNILSDKMRNLGHKLILLGDCYVYHEGESSTEKNISIDKLRNWHMGWSEAYYISKGNKKLNKLICANLIVKIRRAIVFLIFFKIKRFNAIFYRLRGFVGYLKGIDCHTKRDIGPF